MADKNKDQESKVSFTKGLKAEYKRIIWPDKDTLSRQTVTVTNRGIPDTRLYYCSA